MQVKRRAGVRDQPRPGGASEQFVEQPGYLLLVGGGGEYGGQRRCGPAARRRGPGHRLSRGLARRGPSSRSRSSPGRVSVSGYRREGAMLTSATASRFISLQQHQNAVLSADLWPGGPRPA